MSDYEWERLKFFVRVVMLLASVVIIALAVKNGSTAQAICGATIAYVATKRWS